MKDLIIIILDKIKTVTLPILALIATTIATKLIGKLNASILSKHYYCINALQDDEFVKEFTILLSPILTIDIKEVFNKHHYFDDDKYNLDNDLDKREMKINNFNKNKLEKSRFAFVFISNEALHDKNFLEDIENLKNSKKTKCFCIVANSYNESELPQYLQKPIKIHMSSNTRESVTSLLNKLSDKIKINKRDIRTNIKNTAIDNFINNINLNYESTVYANCPQNTNCEYNSVQNNHHIMLTNNVLSIDNTTNQSIHRKDFNKNVRNNPKPNTFTSKTRKRKK